MYEIYLIENIKNNRNNINNINNNNNNNVEKTNLSNIIKVLVIGSIILNKLNNIHQYSNQFDYGIDFSNVEKVNNDSGLLINNENLHLSLEIGIKLNIKQKQKQISSIEFIIKISLQIISYTFYGAKKDKFQAEKFTFSHPLEEKMNDILNKANYTHIKIIIKIFQEYLTVIVKNTLDNFKKWYWINNDYSVKRKNNKCCLSLYFPRADQQIAVDRLIDIYGEIYLDNISNNINYFIKTNNGLYLFLFMVHNFLNINNKIFITKHQSNRKNQLKIKYIKEKIDENEETINSLFIKIYKQLFDDDEKYRNILRNFEKFTINFIENQFYVI